MRKQVARRFKDLLKRDPWLIAKYVAATLALGAIGKLMLVGARDGADVPVAYAQFVPTVPMMMLTFLVHRFLWKHREAGFGSYIGKHWTAAYGVQFVAGHGLFIIFAVWLGLHYLGVSVAIGAVTAVTTFAYNEWRVFRRLEEETDIA